LINCPSRSANIDLVAGESVHVFLVLNMIFLAESLSRLLPPKNARKSRSQEWE
jgi:hypothetical protein